MLWHAFNLSKIVGIRNKVRRMKLPGPDHPITITANRNRIDAIEISSA